LRGKPAAEEEFLRRSRLVRQGIQRIFQPLQGHQVFIPALVHLPGGIVPEGVGMRAIRPPVGGYWAGLAVGPLGGVPVMRAFSSSVFKSKVL